MDEKTEKLRDIFRSVTGEDTVTERQAADRGSLENAGDERAALRSVVEDMREALDFETSFSTDELVMVVERFYEGDSDPEIAQRLGEDVVTRDIQRARLDLHLVRDGDTDTPFDLDRLANLLDADTSVAAIGDDLDASGSTVRLYSRVLEAQRERRRVADRYRQEFETALRDRDLAERLTSSLQETGLEGATEDQEVDVDL